MIKIDNIVPHMYGILFAVGILTSFILALAITRKKKIELFDFLCATAYVLIGAIIGAKLLFILVSLEEIARLQLSFLQIMQGGFVFYGGFIGASIGLYLYCRHFNSSFTLWADIFTLVLPLGHAFGRMGCLFAGCCYGIEYSGFGCVEYLQSTNANTPIGINLLPIQAIESALLLLLFITLAIRYKKQQRQGICACIYCISYAVIRFILEFFRGDKERGIALFLSTSQLISIAIIIFVSIIIIITTKKKADF